MKVLLAFEEEFRAYIEAIATAIRTFRSDVEVAVVEDSELEAEVERFSPQLVLTSPPPLPKNPVGEKLIAWIECSPDTCPAIEVSGRGAPLGVKKPCSTPDPISYRRNQEAA